jgi:hypothetical protein
MSPGDKQQKRARLPKVEGKPCSQTAQDPLGGKARIAQASGNEELDSILHLRASLSPVRMREFLPSSSNLQERYLEETGQVKILRNSLVEKVVGLGSVAVILESEVSRPFYRSGLRTIFICHPS